MARTIEQALDWLDLPLDVAMGWPQIILEGNRRLRFENHKGIYEYSPERLRIQSTLGILCIEGEALQLRTLEKGWITVEGRLHQLRFEHASPAEAVPTEGGQR